MFEYPIERELKKIGYYTKFREVYFPPTSCQLDLIYGKWNGGYAVLPEGLPGEVLMSLRKSLSAEYRIIEGGQGEIEVLKRGAGVTI